MNKILSCLIVLFLSCILLTIIFIGYFEEQHKSEKDEILTPDIQLDQPSMLPDWKDGEYHDYYGTMEMLSDFNVK